MKLKLTEEQCRIIDFVKQMKRGQKLKIEAKAGSGKMFCLAGVAGQVPGIVADMKKAEKVLVIDGCAADCAAHALRLAGCRTFDHLRICDMELKRDDAAICNVNLQKVVEKGRAILEGWSTGG